MKKLICIFALLSLASCSSTPKEKKAVLGRAPFDLNCDKSKIEILEISKNTYGASGCSKRASYKAYCDVGGCDVKLESETKNNN